MVLQPDVAPGETLEARVRYADRRRDRPVVRNATNFDDGAGFAVGLALDPVDVDDVVEFEVALDDSPARSANASRSGRTYITICLGSAPVTRPATRAGSTTDVGVTLRRSR